MEDPGLTPAETATHRTRARLPLAMRRCHPLSTLNTDIITPVAYIICEPCVGTKDTACVDVCPVDCIHPRKDEPAFEAAEMLYIHPDECIDCGACVPACPVEAIFSLDETPHKWADYIPKNASYYDRDQ